MKNIPGRNGRGSPRDTPGRRSQGGFGPGGECRCPNCGHREPHQINVPCYTKVCPKCGAPMTRA